MDETPPALPPELSPSPPIGTSLLARLMNIFAVPGDVFDEVKSSPHSPGNWLVPALIGAVVGVVAIFLVFSDSEIQRKFREQQEQAMEKQLAKLVQAGKMTQQQADQQKEMAEKFMGPTVTMITGSATSAVWSFVRVFLWGLVLWLAGRWLLGARFDYLKAVEVAGLAAMVGALGTLAKLLLQMNLSSFTSSPSLALAVKAFDPKNPWHLVLAGLNFFDLWELALLGLGLARLAGVPFVRAALPVFGVWLLFSSAMITVAAVMQRLFG